MTRTQSRYIVIDLLKSSETAKGSILRHGRCDDTSVRLLRLIDEVAHEVIGASAIFIVATDQRSLRAEMDPLIYASSTPRLNALVATTAIQSLGITITDRLLFVAVESILLSRQTWRRALELVDQYQLGLLSHFPTPFGLAWISGSILDEMTKLFSGLPNINILEQVAAVLQTSDSSDGQIREVERADGEIVRGFQSESSPGFLMELERIAVPTFLESEYDEELLRGACKSALSGQSISGYQARAGAVVQRIQELSRLNYPPPGIRAEKPTVAFVSTKTGYSGAEESLALSLRVMKEIGVNPVVFVGSKGVSHDRYRSVGADVATFDADPTDPIVQMSAIMHFIKSSDAQAVHFNGTEQFQLALMVKAMGLPLIQHVRFSEVKGLISYLSIPDVVLTVSDFVAGLIQSSGAGAKVQRLYNLLPDLTATSPNGARESFALILSRITRGKNLRFALDTWAHLHSRKDLDTKLIICGETLAADQDYAHELRLHASALGIGKLIEWRNFDINNRDLLASARFLFSPSETEPFARSALEAIVKSVPVLAPRCAGFLEQIPTGLHHTLYSPADEVEAAAIAKNWILGASSGDYVAQCQDWIRKACSVENHVAGWKIALTSLGLKV